MYRTHAEAYLEAMQDVLDRGAFVLQEENRKFDQQFGRYVGVPDGRCFGVANGTDALVIALRAAGVEPGVEVILPSHTYVATAAAVHFIGAKPVLVDCATDHLIDPEAVGAAVSSRTRCVMPVQLNGRTADMDEILRIAKRHDLVVVEDAAQGVGSKFKGKSAGTFGECGTYSFFPAKTLGCFGDGGAVVAASDKSARQVALLRDHGRNTDGSVVGWGFNSRLDNLQAAILLTRMNFLDAEIARRREIAQSYQDGLGDLEQLILPPPPNQDPDHFDSYQNYEIEAERRDELRTHLSECGIGTLIQWGGFPLHWIEALQLNFDLPRTDEVFSRCLLLPMNSMLTNPEVEEVIAAVRAFYGVTS